MTSFDSTTPFESGNWPFDADEPFPPLLLEVGESFQHFCWEAATAVRAGGRAAYHLLFLVLRLFRAVAPFTKRYLYQTARALWTSLRWVVTYYVGLSGRQKICIAALVGCMTLFLYVWRAGYLKRTHHVVVECSRKTRRSLYHTRTSIATYSRRAFAFCKELLFVTFPVLCFLIPMQTYLPPTFYRQCFTTFMLCLPIWRSFLALIAFYGTAHQHSQRETGMVELRTGAGENKSEGPSTGSFAQLLSASGVRWLATSAVECVKVILLGHPPFQSQTSFHASTRDGSQLSKRSITSRNVTGNFGSVASATSSFAHERDAASLFSPSEMVSGWLDYWVAAALFDLLFAIPVWLIFCFVASGGMKGSMGVFGHIDDTVLTTFGGPRGRSSFFFSRKRLFSFFLSPLMRLALLFHDLFYALLIVFLLTHRQHYLSTTREVLVDLLETCFFHLSGVRLFQINVTSAPLQQQATFPQISQNSVSHRKSSQSLSTSLFSSSLFSQNETRRVSHQSMMAAPFSERQRNTRSISKYSPSPAGSLSEQQRSDTSLYNEVDDELTSLAILPRLWHMLQGHLPHTLRRFCNILLRAPHILLLLVPSPLMPICVYGVSFVYPVWAATRALRFSHTGKQAHWLSYFIVQAPLTVYVLQPLRQTFFWRYLFLARHLELILVIGLQLVCMRADRARLWVLQKLALLVREFSSYPRFPGSPGTAPPPLNNLVKQEPCSSSDEDNTFLRSQRETSNPAGPASICGSDTRSPSNPPLSEPVSLAPKASVPETAIHRPSAPPQLSRYPSLALPSNDLTHIKSERRTIPSSGDNISSGTTTATLLSKELATHPIGHGPRRRRRS